MNILFITNSIGFGGVEKMLAFVANGLSQRGHLIGIANLNGVPGYCHDLEQSFNAEVSVLNVGTSMSGLRKRWYQFKKVRIFAKDLDAHVLIGFTAFPNFFASLIAKSLHVRSIVSERGDPSRTFNMGIADKLLLYFINRADGAVFQIEGAKAFYSNALTRKSVLIPNPIFVKDTLEYIPIANREKSVVSVGRFNNQQKRYDVMIRAFGLFHKKHPEYEFKLYGKGEDEPLMRHWIEEAGVKECARFMGLTSDSMNAMKSEGIFVITSDYEGIPNALLEAMAAGMPVVATDCTPGGARMLITNSLNGLLVPVNNPKAVCEALCTYVENPDLASEYSLEARKVLERFTPSVALDKWERYIKKIIES